MGTHLNMYRSRTDGSFTPPRLEKEASDYITMKKWYVEWYINDYFTLLFGKSITPTNFFPSNQMFWGGYGFNNVGCLSTGAYPLVQLTFKSPQDYIFTNEIKAAAIKVDTSVIEIKALSGAGFSYQCESKMPKLEISLKFNVEKGIFSTYGNFATGYQKYTVVLFQGTQNLTKAKCYLKVPSYVLGGDIGVKVGMVSLAVDAFYGKNIGISGF
jgi:hypothetical protein